MLNFAETESGTIPMDELVRLAEAPKVVEKNLGPFFGAMATRVTETYPIPLNMSFNWYMGYLFGMIAGAGVFGGGYDKGTTNQQISLILAQSRAAQLALAAKGREELEKTNENKA